MRASLIFASLVLVGGIVTARPVEGQYPFIDPSDPCYKTITGTCSVVIPDNQAAAWSDSDALAAFLLHLRSRIRDLAMDAEMMNAGPNSFEGWTAERLKEFAETTAQIVDCLPKLEGLINRVGERLKELGVDTVVDTGSRSHERLERDGLIKEINGNLADYLKNTREILRRIGGE